jgi:hypothetical protein
LPVEDEVVDTVEVQGPVGLVLICPTVGGETVKVTGVLGTGVVMRRVATMRGWVARVSTSAVWELPEITVRESEGREVTWVGLLPCWTSNPSAKPSPSVSGRRG